MNIHEQVAEKVELAGVYMQDGAFHTATRLLREAADLTEAHAKRCDAALAEAMQ
jgi:hypothetical protein